MNGIITIINHQLVVGRSYDTTDTNPYAAGG